MSHYDIEELLMRWTREDLTAEQAIGQILQLLIAQQRRLHALERRLAEQTRPGDGQDRKTGRLGAAETREQGDKMTR